MAARTITQRVTANARRRGVTIYDRGQWKSKHRGTYALRRITRHHKLLSKKPADTLVQHITVTRDTGDEKPDFFTDMRTVERIGYERFKSGVSYNFVWDMETGEIGIGMPLDAKGTHTVNLKNVPNYSYDQNYVALAIAALGMPGDKPTPVALLQLERLIAALIDEKALTMGHDYVPHRLFAWKDCPTDPVVEKMPEINDRAKALARKS